MCWYVPSNISCGDNSVAMSKGCQKVVKYTEIMCFELFFRHFVFNVDVDGSREMTIKDYIKVSVVANLECGNI